MMAHHLSYDQRRRLIFMGKSQREKRQLILIEREKAAMDYHELRGQLIVRDGYKCLCCGAFRHDLQIDHIRPVALGGLTQLDNLQLLCPVCNKAKGCQTIDYRANRRLYP